MSRHLGNLTVTADNAAAFPPVDEFFGHLTVAAGAHLVAPNLKMIRGWLTILPGARLEAIGLGEIKGWLNVGEGSVVNAPNLRAVERDVFISSTKFYGAIVTAGSLRIAGNVQMDDLVHIAGGLTVVANGVAKLTGLENVGGSITLKAGAHLLALKLNHIGGFYDADETSEMIAPAFTA